MTRMGGRDYYDPARQEDPEEHDCDWEDGEWWFGHGMVCRYPELHSGVQYADPEEVHRVAERIVSENQELLERLADG